MEHIDKLMSIPSPSGNETKTAELIHSLAKDCVDDSYTDDMGNLILHKKGDGKCIMLTAHMDVPGIIVTVIEEDGAVRFSPIGNISPKSLANRRIMFLDGSEGIIASKSEKADIRDMTLDTFGQQVNVGDVAVLYREPHYANNRWCGSNLSAAAPCTVLLDAIRQMNGSKYNLFYVFTVQRELNSRGAVVAANKCNPDLSISVDYVSADTGNSHIKAGKGCAVRIKDKSIITHNSIRDAVFEAVKLENLTPQIEVSNDFSSDAGAIALNNSGVVSGCISIPVKLCHTDNQVCYVSDIKMATKILISIIEGEYF